jgi:hypothetical protein
MAGLVPASAQAGGMVAAEARIYDRWHYVPVLACNLGALRDGAPFRDWVLPAVLKVSAPVGRGSAGRGHAGRAIRQP